MDVVEQLIDDARKDAGWKWSEVARRSGLHQQTLRRYRSGEVRTDDTARRIEIAFGWPRGHIDSLARGEVPSVNAELRQQVAALMEEVARLQGVADAADRGTGGHGSDTPAHKRTHASDVPRMRNPDEVRAQLTTIEQQLRRIQAELDEEEEPDEPDGEDDGLD